MLDSKSKAWPDLDAMIHTCQGTKTLEDQEAVYNTFKDVYNRTVEQGHVTDDYFDTWAIQKTGMQTVILWSDSVKQIICNEQKC